MTTRPAARTFFAIAVSVTLLATMAPVAQAAIPTNATMRVSATVLPACNNTDCRDIPRVVRYEPASGTDGQPAFELTVADGRRIMTVTY